MHRIHLSCMLLRNVRLFNRDVQQVCNFDLFSQSYERVFLDLIFFKGIKALIFLPQNYWAITFHYLLQTRREDNRNGGGGKTIEMWWCDGKITTILFPGCSPTRPYGAREWDPSDVSFRNREITNKRLWGGADKCEIFWLAVKHTIHWHFQYKFNIQGFSLQYRSISCKTPLCRIQLFCDSVKIIDFSDWCHPLNCDNGSLWFLRW